jgi:hypothetical protein
MSQQAPAIPKPGPHPPTPPLPQDQVHGTSPSAAGVLGESNTGPGVSGRSVAAGGGNPPVATQGGNSDGVWGESQGNGVHGISSHNGDGVLGESPATGVHGVSSHDGDGVFGESQTTGVHGKGGSVGVLGEGGNGVIGRSANASASGVWGDNSGGGHGVSGSTKSDFKPDVQGTAGVLGTNSGSGTGVRGQSAGGDGMLGYSWGSGHAGVSAINAQGGPKSYGLYASGQPAGRFEGNIEVTGDVQLVNMDCAEDFEFSGKVPIDPGSVVIIDSGTTLKLSHQAYDRRVAGVVSGAGRCKPAIILGRSQEQHEKVSVALMGRVYCKVDADIAPIEIGDLLTTSHTPGHAMRASDPSKAFGAVIGKALDSLETGRGLILILTALQ